jgi:ABC-type multidrug transport system fused ATPase/permease subunit
MAGRTTIIIAHRLSTVRSADQIVVLEGKRIIEMGKHDNLIANGGLLPPALHRPTPARTARQWID